jgi:alcohol dehydrogenase
MKAVQVTKYGGIEVLAINDTSSPTPANGFVLVDIKSASINPFDYKLREGYMKEMIPLTLPYTIGGDFSGVVSQVGEGVTELKAGDEVFGSAGVAGGGSGSFAEQAVTKAGSVAKKPTSVSFDEAAALPLVGSSAVQALEEHIKLQKGQKILIHGGAGGIGHVAIQIAKAIGAHVITTVSSNDVEFVKQLGADEVIDYKTQKFEEIVKDVDAVFDTVGGETTNTSINVIKSGGVLVTMAGQPDEDLAKQKGITAISQFTQTNTAHLSRVAELVDSGKLKVNIEKTFPLDQFKEAFEFQEKVHPKGKVVIKI